MINELSHIDDIIVVPILSHLHSLNAVRRVISDVPIGLVVTLRAMCSHKAVSFAKISGGVVQQVECMLCTH